MNPQNERPSNRQLLVTTGVAAAVAVAALFIAVLPAEYGIDPLRTGKLLGLVTDEPSSFGAHQPASQEFAEYNVTIDLPANSDWVESGLKMWLDVGEIMLYEWSSNGDITYDLHTDQLGSYDEGAGTGTSGQGLLTAPVDGYHGFAVRNTGDSPATLTLRLIGEFDPLQDLR